MTPDNRWDEVRELMKASRELLEFQKRFRGDKQELPASQKRTYEKLKALIDRADQTIQGGGTSA